MNISYNWHSASNGVNKIPFLPTIRHNRLISPNGLELIKENNHMYISMMYQEERTLRDWHINILHIWL